jgi:hypothetical protein
MLIRHLPIIFICVVACTSKSEISKNKVESQKRMDTDRVSIKNTSNNDMSNPVLMVGTDIGSLFKTYYKVGYYDRMIQYTDSATINKFGRDSLMKMYRKLNLGYDIKLKSLTTEGNKKILHYESQTFATKAIRRLHVLIENDTARIVPQHLEKGDIFE